MAEQILPSEEYTEAEGRVYINPQAPVNSTNEFIENFRRTQQDNDQRATAQTQSLGAEVSSGLGGLTGAGSYFRNRYQTSQTNQALQNLRAVAQADALNTALANEKAFWQKRYNDAYKKYQKSSNSNGGNSGNVSNTGSSQGDISQETTTVKIGNVQVDQLTQSMWMKKVDDYIKSGMSPSEAMAQASADMGLE